MKKSKRKALGQHFLINRTILNKIVKTIDPQQEDLIIEIGAGKGALTFPLARKAGKVIAIEKEKSFIPILQSRNIPNLTILEKDILRIDFKELIKKGGNSKANVKLVGNLPYSISSPLLFKVFRDKDLFPESIFLLQKQVAERICAKPESKKYAPLSILFQIYFSTKIHFIVTPEAFSPPPRVDSALISLKKRQVPLFPIKDDQFFLKFLKGAFRHRRKILPNNLEKLHFPSPLIEKALQKCKINRDLRPEQLTISQFVTLFNIFFPGGKENIV